MAAPAYTWEFVYDLWGDRVPKKVTLEAVASLLVKEGNLVYMSSGQVEVAGASSTTLLGLAAETIDVAATAADPVDVYLLAPGMVIRGTADADASGLTGFGGKTQDLNADGSLDVADTSNGCLSVYRVNNAAGTEVDCVICEFDMGCVN
jgi:hypothetical protein